ncbi:MAG TPA: hypothetical protein VJ576_21200 [Rhodocyclaceae bacterium]|nr:hypothetical protein [Rhodocyclaceae bacterium]
MAKPDKPEEGLIETGKPDDPAKQENQDTRLDQLQPDGRRSPDQDDKNPALDTTKEAGQGAG